MSPKITTPQLVWSHGLDQYNSDGTSTQVSHLRPLNGRFPARMFCEMVTTWGADGREVEVRVIRQARSKHARRTDTFRTIGQAQTCALKWAGRICREHIRDGLMQVPQS